MEMIRTWHKEVTKPLLPMLEQFGIKPKKISLLKFEGLTPDSYIWFFNADGKNYCLYEEDFVPSIEHVKKMIEDNQAKWPQHDTFELMKVATPQKWEDAGPVRTATVYQAPENPEQFMEYAAVSGHFFVFLAISKLSEEERL